MERTFVPRVILKRKGSSCVGGDPGDNYYPIVTHQCAGNLDLDVCSVIFACFSLFHQNTESRFQGSIVLKEGKRCFAREQLDPNIFASILIFQLNYRIAVQMHYAVEIVKVVH